MLYKQQYSADDLAGEIARGNEIAFRQMFGEYHNKLFNYILKITGSRETAEDIVHDVFLKIWTSREKLSEVKNLNAYLYRMCHNQALNGFRRMSTEVLVMAALKKRPGISNMTPEDTLLNKEVRQFIQQAINTLTPQQKIVFKMSREDGLKQEEIARELDISITTVKKHLTNGLNHLRDLISKEYGSRAVALLCIFSLSN